MVCHELLRGSLPPFHLQLRGTCSPHAAATDLQRLILKLGACVSDLLASQIYHLTTKVEDGADDSFLDL